MLKIRVSNQLEASMAEKLQLQDKSQQEEQPDQQADPS